MNKGFTLIELLVVVLIIGILSAIALPQYTRSVEKARMAEAVVQLEELKRAQDLFFMEHGRFAPDIPTLSTGSIAFPEDMSNAEWSYSIYHAAASGSTPEIFALRAVRLKGSLAGGELSIALTNGGHRTCSGTGFTPAGTPFCKLAASLGFEDPGMSIL